MKKILVTGLLGGFFSMAPVWAADNNDGTETKAYWEGHGINNLGQRLGQPFEGFEVQGQKRRPDGRSPDEYLQTIRKQMASQAVAGKAEAVLNFKPGDIAHALTTTHKDNGTVVLTLQVSALFDENASGLKNGATEVLDRLLQILGNSSGGPPRELVLVDQIDAIPEIDALDAERCQYVLAYLTFNAL